MARFRVVPLAVALTTVALLGACSSSSKSTTKTTAAGVTVTAPAASGTKVEVTAGDTKGLQGKMTLVPATTSASSGDVTFTVKNTGTIDHEMIVLKTDVAYNKLPIVDAGDPPAKVSTGADKVDEANNIGETGDPNLKPGVTRTFTVKKMVAGNYVLVCNIAKHYGLGMYAKFTVK